METNTPLAGIGFASNFVPVYQAEVSPAHLRGMMIGLYQTGINISQLIGACIDQGTFNMTTRWAYRIPLITEMFFPLVIGLGVWFFPETPHELITFAINFHKVDN
jgi:SP family sugar:H+ symporter-like MFS transporter